MHVCKMMIIRTDGGCGDRDGSSGCCTQVTGGLDPSGRDVEQALLQALLVFPRCYVSVCGREMVRSFARSCSYSDRGHG
jgi:hypothetical protein